jgi:hypothetical protein
MSETSKLYCTQDEETGEWFVWFPHPLGGMNVLETFDSEEDAKKFYQDQLDSAEIK